MSEPARAAAPASLEDHRARKEKTHRWTRWRDEIPKLYPDLPSRALELASELARRADNDTGHLYRKLAGTREAPGLSEATHLSVRTVQRAMIDLKEKGLIKARPSGRKRIDFWLQPHTERGGQPTTPCRNSHATVSQQPRQEGVSDSPPCRISNDTVASPLTAVGTTKETGPPRSPTGGRRRDHEKHSEDLRSWTIDNELPVRWLDLIRSELRRWERSSRRTDPRSFVAAYLEEKTDWRDPRAPEPSSMSVPLDVATQLELPL